MESILQIIVTGIAMGFIYSLVATEYTLIYNATGLVNFSHEAFIVLGAFLFGGTFMNLFSSTIVAILSTLVVMLLFGMLVSSGIFNPLRNMPFITYAMFGTMMLSRIILDSIRLIWGPIPFTVKGFLRGNIQLGSVILAKSYIYIIIIAILSVAAIQFVFRYTKIGKAMRCVSQDKEAAALMGINVTQNINLTVGISAMICGIIGILISPIFNIATTMGATTALKGFCAGVVGGFGSYPGAILGGLLIGLLEQFGIMIFPAVYKDVVAFVVMILFLLIKPKGIVKIEKA